MTQQERKGFSEMQLRTLQSAMHAGAAKASESLAGWIDKPSVIELDGLQQVPLEEAAALLSDSGEQICFCVMAVQGWLSGQMILAFDDASGLSLAEMLLEPSAEQESGWTELATSAALETTNIVCCAYLNSLAESLSERLGPIELIPQPPSFAREYATSLMEFVLMEQAMESDLVFVAKTRFTIDHHPVSWTLLFVPDAQSKQKLKGWLDAESGA